MLKKVITFKNFNDEDVTETLYFNLTKSELIELESEYEGGFQANMTAIAEASDTATLIKEFKKILMMSVGRKSADGNRFIKNDEVRTEFEQSAAYDAIFMELASNEAKAAEFIQGIMPKDLALEVAKENEAKSEERKSTAQLAAEMAGRA